MAYGKIYKIQRREIGKGELGEGERGEGESEGRRKRRER